MVDKLNSGTWEPGTTGRTLDDEEIELRDAFARFFKKHNVKAAALIASREETDGDKIGRVDKTYEIVRQVLTERNGGEPTEDALEAAVETILNKLAEAAKLAVEAKRKATADLADLI